MPTINLSNYENLSSRDLYQYLQDNGYNVIDPTAAALEIDHKVAGFAEYCSKADLAAEYAAFANANFDPISDVLAFSTNINTTYLAVIHEHSLEGQLGDAASIVATYKEELEEGYRDYLINFVMEILNAEVPDEEHVTLDIAVLREAMRQVDQHLKHYANLIALLEDNDQKINQALGLDNAQTHPKKIKDALFAEIHALNEGYRRPAKYKKQKPEDYRRDLVDILSRKYAAVAMVQDKKFMQDLDAEFRQQHELMRNLGIKSPPPPARPRNLINGYTLNKHLARVKRRLHTKHKPNIDYTKAQKQMAHVLRQRQAIMQEHLRNMHKHASIPTRTTHIFTDIGRKDVKSQVQQTLMQALEIIKGCAASIKDMINCIADKASAPLQTCNDACDRIMEEATAIRDDLNDIRSEAARNPFMAVMKVIALAQYLYQTYKAVRDNVSEATWQATGKFMEAKDRATKYIEPLLTTMSSLAGRVAQLLPFSGLAERLSFDYYVKGMKTRQKAGQRKES